MSDATIVRMPLVRRDGSVDGERVTLSGIMGEYGPIQVSAELVSVKTLRDYWRELDGSTPALSVGYRGHRDDLATAGCFRLGLERPFREFRDFRVDGHGGLYWISNAAARGRRGWMSISYYAISRVFAESLPWIQDLVSVELTSMGEPLFRPSWLLRDADRSVH